MENAQLQQLNEHKHGALFKVSILVLALDGTVGNIISGILPLMKQHYSAYSGSLVENILTIPSFSMLLFILLSPYIAQHIGTKKTGLIGLGLTFLCGVAPFFIDNIYAVLVIRFIFGAGVGLVSPLIYSYTSFLYDDVEKAQMLGWGGSFTNVLNVIMTYLLGFLIQFSWKAGFLAYGIFAITFLLVLFFAPDLKIKPHKTSKAERSSVFNRKTVKYLIYLFILFIDTMIFYAKYASTILEGNYGDVTQATFILGTLSVIAILGGLLFGFVYKVTTNKLFYISMLMMAIGFLGVSLATNIFVNGFFTFLYGFGTSWVSSSLFFLLFQAVSKEQGSIISSFALIAVNLGVFCSTFFSGFLTSVFHISHSATYLQIISGITLAIAVIEFISRRIEAKSNVIEEKEETID